MNWTFYCWLLLVDLAVIAWLVIRNCNLTRDVAFWRGRCLNPKQSLN